jgi:hypothetical protein
VQSLKDAGYGGRDAEYPWGIFKFLYNAVMTCAIFIKTMSDEDEESVKFDLLDEAEWRIPYTDHMVKEGRIRATGLERPRARIPFTQSDLKALILPDNRTRKQALGGITCSSKSKHIVKWLFKDPANVPIIATVDECRHF